MPARRTTTTTLEKKKKKNMNTTNNNNNGGDNDEEEKTTQKGEKKKQKSQQKQQKFLQREKKNTASSSFSSSSSYSKDPLKSLQTSEEDKEEFVNFLLKEEEEEDNNTISLQVSMQFVRDAVREYPGVKLNKELLEDTEAALAFFGGGDRGGGFFIEEEEEEDDDDTGNENELKQPHRRLQNFLKLEDFEEMIDETTGARTVLLTIPSSKEEDAATTKRTVLLNTLKISEQNREIGEREERARREDLLEAKKKLVSQANTTAAAKGKTTSSGGVGKKKAGTKSSAAAIKKKKDDDEGEMKIGGEDKDEDKQEEKDDEILPDGDDILSGSCAATRRFNSGKFQLDQSKKIHGAIADDKVFKFLREFKKEVYETYRLRSLVEKMDFSSDDDMNQKSDDRENVLECIRIWINMRGMVVSARLALIEREKFLKDCEAMTKFASDYRKDTKAVSKASVPTEKATTVVAPSKMKATDATTTTILKEIPTYSIANRSLSSWSILLNEDDEALLDDEYVEKNDIDDDIDDDDNQRVLTIEDQLESEIKTYEQEQTFNQMIIKGHLAHVTPAGEEFRDATAKLEKALEKILRSPSLSTKTSHDRDRLLASTKWSADQTMVFDDLILLCDNAYFPSNEKACKAADDINRHVLYRAVSVLKKAFEILSDFVDKDLVVGSFKKSAARLFSSTLEQTYRRQFSNMLNNILDPYDTLIDYGAETKLLMFVRMRVTNAMEIDSALRERAHQTVISACLEQMLSGKFDQFSRQKTEKFIEDLLFEEETEEEEKKKKKAAKSSSSSSKKKKKKSNKAGKDTPAPVSEKKEEVSDKEDDDEKEEGEEGKEEEQGKEEVTPTPTLVVPVALQESEECMEEENLEAWQEVKKVRGAKTSPSSVIVAPKDLVVSKVKISPVKKIPAAKQQQQQRSELSSSPPLPKSPPPKEVVTAAVEKKREVTRRALFVDTLKKNETAPAPIVVVEEETKEEKEEEAREEEEEEQQQKVADNKEESNDTYVVRSVSDIEQSFCAASNPPPDQQQHYHHHHQHYQPPLPQMPPPQMVDGQRVIFVPMIIPDSGSMPHPMPFGMHHHHSMAPPLPPPMPRLPDTSEAVVSMYNKFYHDVMMQQQYPPPPPTQRSSSSNIGAATNEAVSDTASTASDDHPCAAAAKSSSSSSSSSSTSPPLPKTPPPKGQQQMIQHHKSASSSPSMSPSASSSSIRIPSPRPIDLARISSAAFPKPRRSSREYRRDNHHHNHGNDSNDDRNSNSKREEEFPALSKDKNGGKASNVMSLAKSNKSWAEAQMELKGTSLPSLTSSPMKPPSLPQQHHQMQRQVA